MKYVPKAVTRTVGRTVLRTQKNAPTLLFVAGVGSAVTATVLACRATLKAQKPVEDFKKGVIEVDIASSRHQIGEQQLREEKTRHFIRLSGELTKLYAPAVLVGGVSVACLTKSHKMLTERNAALATAYVGLQKFLESYRGRVREKVGEDQERDIYAATTAVELVEDTPNGPRKVFSSRPTALGPYSAIFNEENTNWQDSSDYNVAFIRIQQDHMTDLLISRGHVFLNEVYDRLGIDRTANGQICGWFLNHPDSDDFIEIRITPMHDFHGSLMLDFNVAGRVYDMLEGGGR